MRERLRRSLGRRAFRRPLDASEISRYLAFHKESRQAFGSESATRLIIEALAQSPHFLYRTELGQEGPVRGLDAYERASLLAFSLTDGPPDATLLTAAAGGELDTADGVLHAAEALVDSPAASAAFAGFVNAHLGLGDLGESAELADDLIADLRTQTDRFVADVVWEDGGTMDELFLAPSTVANRRLAELQGLSGAPDSFTRMETDGRIRFGVLTGAYLASHVGPVKRGEAFKLRMLCEPVPEPPADAQAQAAELFPSDPEATEAELYARFRESAPGCASCHATFHPLGLAFENYDGQGRYRETNHAGRLIDTANEIAGADGWSGRFTGARDLVEQVVHSQAGRACFVRRYLSHALGDDLTQSPENCAVRQTWAGMARASELDLRALAVGGAVAAAMGNRVFEE